MSPPFFVSDLQSFTYTLSTELPSFRRISGPLKAQVIRHRQRMIQHRPSRAIRVHRPAHHPPGSLFTAGPEFITIVIPTGPRFRKQADAPTMHHPRKRGSSPLAWDPNHKTFQIPGRAFSRTCTYFSIQVCASVPASKFEFKGNHQFFLLRGNVRIKKIFNLPNRILNSSFQIRRRKCDSISFERKQKNTIPER